MSLSDIPTLYPPPTFTTIIPGPLPVHRCTSLPATSRQFLKTLSLASILHLPLEPPTKFTTSFCADHSITLHHIPNVGGRGSEPLSIRTFEKILGKLKQEARPALIVDGGNPVFVAVLRKWQGWAWTSVVLEYRGFCEEGGGGGGRYRVEEWLEGVDLGGVKRVEGVEFGPRREVDRELSREEEDGVGRK